MDDELIYEIFRYFRGVKSVLDEKIIYALKRYTVNILILIKLNKMQAQLCKYTMTKGNFKL